MKKVLYKSEGIPGLMPYLIVEDGRRSLEFYKKAFGFSACDEVIEKNGKVLHAEMIFHDARFMFGSDPENPPRTPRKMGADFPLFLYMYCPDVEEQFMRVKRAGAELISVPKTQFYGDRNFEVRDLDGFRWMFAEKVAEFDPNSIPS